MESITFRLSALLALLLFYSAGGQAATLMWTNTSGGNWSVAANWNPHQVPGAGDVAAITLTTASKLEVRMDVDVTIAGLTMGGSAHVLRVGGKTLTLGGTSTIGPNQEIVLDQGAFVGSAATRVTGGSILWSGGRLQGPVTLEAGSQLVLQGTIGNPYDLEGVLTNKGTVRLVSGNLRCRAAQIYNLSGGVIDFQGDADMANYSVGTELLENQGTIRKSTGSGISAVDVFVQNAGTVEVLTGTLDFSNGGAFTPGTAFSGTGTNVFSGATVEISSTLAPANGRLAGATLAGSGGHLGGSWLWTSGRIGADQSVLTLDAGGVLALKATAGNPYDLQGVFTNLGSFQLRTGNLRLRDGQFYNAPGAVMEFQSDVDVANYSIGSELIDNRGTVRKASGAGISSVDVRFQNSGVVAAQAGTISFYGGGNFSAGSTFPGSGTNEFAAGTFLVDTQITVPNARIAGATVVGNLGSLSGSWVWTSGRVGEPGTALVLATDGTLTLKAIAGNLYDLQGTFSNYGVIRLVTGNLRLRDAHLYIQKGGLLDFQSDADLANYGTGEELLYNLGTIRKSGGTGTSNIDVEIWSSAAVDVQTGTLSYTSGGEQLAGVTFTGTGTNEFAGGVFAIRTNLAIPQARLAGATLVGVQGSLSGSWLWTSGRLGGADSTLTLASDGVLVLKGIIGNLYDLEGALTNAGTLRLARGNLRFRDSQLYNLPNGLVDFESDSDISDYGIGTEQLSNLGTVRKSAGTGLSSVDVWFQNSGQVAVSTGALSFENGGELNPGSLFTGAGTNRFAGGVFSISTTVRIPNAQLAGATLAGANGTLGGSWIWTSGTLGQPDSTLTLANDGILILKGIVGNLYDLQGALTNVGVLQLQSGNLRIRDAQFVNAAGGLLEFRSDSDIANYNAGAEALVNSGVVRKSVGSDISYIEVPFTNLGTLDAQIGTVNLQALESLAGGRIQCGINGPASCGRVHLKGNISLAGSFGANLNNGYLPAVGETFQAVSFDSHVGTFASTALPSGITWRTNYSTTFFTLQVLSVSTSDVVLSIKRANGQSLVTWNSHSGTRYQPQFKSSLSDAAWTDLGPILTATGNTCEFADTTAPGLSLRFYRVAQLP
jgi:hypothetical protein